jgi:hypothetical protein
MGVHKMQVKRTRAPGNGPHLKKCKACGDFEVSTQLMNGECPECSGQLALVLRGDRGRFLSLGPKARHASGGGRR